MRCGCFGLPHCGQRFTRGAWIRCVARRLSRRALEVFFFGTAMSRGTVAKIVFMPGTLAATKLTQSHGADVVLDRVSLVVPPRARIGVVGPNGAGKTTLLRVLAGLEEPDSGRVSRRPSDLTVRYLAQQRERPGLSGGEAARAALREIFESDADVLLLDEPTNDLDFDGLALLERFVARTPSSIVVVSHDRAFLERVVDRVVQFEGETRRVQEFAGTWAEYERSREAARRAHEAAYEKYVGERAKFEVLRNERQNQARRATSRKLARETGGSDRRATHALASKVRQADKRLERLEEVEKPWQPWRLHLELNAKSRAGDLVARLDDAIVKRGNFTVGPVSVDLRYGDRLALVGPNGSGKTTLLLGLLGELPLQSGLRTVGPSTRFGVVEQDRSLFERDEPLLRPFAERAEMREGDARSLLAKFALYADEVTRPARSLSPGERTRATLALLAGAGREHARARRADQPPRSRGDRGARAGARGLRGHGRPRHARPPLPRGVPADADARALALDREEPPLAGNALELGGAALAELKPRPGDEVLTVEETSTSPGPASAATRAPMCTAIPPTLPSIRSHSPVWRPARISSPSSTDAFADRAGAADRARRAVERREEAVAGGVDLVAPKPRELTTHDRVMLSRGACARPRPRARTAFAVDPTRSVKRMVASTRSGSSTTAERCQPTRRSRTGLESTGSTSRRASGSRPGDPAFGARGRGAPRGRSIARRCPRCAPAPRSSACTRPLSGPTDSRAPTGSGQTSRGARAPTPAPGTSRRRGGSSGRPPRSRGARRAPSPRRPSPLARRPFASRASEHR